MVDGAGASHALTANMHPPRSLSVAAVPTEAHCSTVTPKMAVIPQARYHDAFVIGDCVGTQAGNPSVRIRSVKLFEHTLGIQLATKVWISRAGDETYQELLSL
jgi:hypothetical protein